MKILLLIPSQTNMLCRHKWVYGTRQTFGIASTFNEHFFKCVSCQSFENFAGFPDFFNILIRGLIQEYFTQSDMQTCSSVAVYSSSYILTC
jgi:hypothetical protein